MRSLVVRSSENSRLNCQLRNRSWRQNKWIVLRIDRAEYSKKQTKLNHEVEVLKNLFYFNMAQASKSSWEPAGGTGMDIKQYNINCTTGQEILVNYGQRFTTMGQIFFDRWRSHNKSTIVKFTDNDKLTTNLQIGGRSYPVSYTHLTLPTKRIV